MQIAVTSQNRKTITEHAGKCRKFWIYEVERGEVASKRLVELSLEQSLHANHHQFAEPLTGINVLITASMGAGLHNRLMQGGIHPVITTEENPDFAVAAYLSNRLEHLSINHNQHCHEHAQHH
jgi:predicted Fe-Mo cluster-binding NifX family protein